MIRKYLLAITASGCLVFFFLFISSASAYEFPPYEGLNLKIDGQLAESYSNNITFASENEERMEDILTVLDLGMGLQYERERGMLGIMGRLSRQMTTKSGDIQNSSERISMNFRNDLSVYDRISFNGSYTHTQVPGLLDEGLDANQCKEFEDRFGRDQVRELYPECDKFEEEFGRFKGKFDSYNVVASLNYNRDFADKFNISTGYSYRSHWTPEQEARDSNGNSLSLRINYGYSPITIFSLSYYFDENRYEERDAISRQSVDIGVRRYITKVLYLSGRFGRDYYSSSDNTEIEVSVTGQIDEKTTTNISYFKGDRLSTDTDDLFRSWRVTGNLTRELLEDLEGSLSGFYGQGTFSSLDVTDSLVGGSVDLSYDFWKHKKGMKMRGTIGYAYSDLDSTDENRVYSRNGVTLGLTVVF